MINKNPYINRKQDSLAHQPKPLTEHYDSPPFIITPQQTFSPSKEPSRHNSYIEPFNSNSKPMNYRPNHHYDYHFKEENHGEIERPTYSPSKPYRNDQYWEWRWIMIFYVLIFFVIFWGINIIFHYLLDWKRRIC